MAARIGVDVGGTYTDLILYDHDSGELRVSKVPTTAAAPEKGVLVAVDDAVPRPILAEADYFLHGTTVGLNALLERQGLRVGLLTTRGFRDVLEIRRGDRDNPYDLLWHPPAPLVPRELRLQVTERLLADGSVHVPLQAEDVRAAAATFAEVGVSCIAIVFLHAYANPAHELAAEAALRDAGFDGDISVSHRVSGEYREYERTCTTVIDALVRPRMSTYLDALSTNLETAGFAGQCLVTRSGGGAMTFGEAQGRPFETILSGPVAGAEGAAELARSLGLSHVITADVGGTSFDTCVITDGRPEVMHQGQIVGLPVQTTWVDVRSIGAGGGSIAYVGAAGLLHVGPRSAGADPGPASYGRGGNEVTVTDAAFALGMLADGNLAGNVQLDLKRALDVLAPLAGELGLSIDGVAEGIIAITAASQANAIREITIEQGKDPREATLIAFGGSGPLFATLLAQELEIATVVIPPYAGNFSAWGLLGADLAQSAARTMIARLGDESLRTATKLIENMFSEIEGRALSNGDASIREVGLDLRYVGQEYSLTVPVQTEVGRIVASPPEIRAAFTREYERTFGHTMEELVEIVALRATVRRTLPFRSNARPRRAASGTSRTSTEAYSFSARQRLPFAVLEAGAITEGTTLQGPALVLEETSTTYVDEGWTATADSTGPLVLVHGEKESVNGGS